MSLKKLIRRGLQKTDLGAKTFLIRDLYRKERRLNKCEYSKWRYLRKYWSDTHSYTGADSSIAIERLLKNVTISLGTNPSPFFYSLDEHAAWQHDKGLVISTTIDYAIILNHSLDDLIMPETDAYGIANNRFLHAVKNYIDRACQEISTQGCQRLATASKALQETTDHKATSFFSALQRILLINQLLWQTGHALNGLGNLDLLLAPYYDDDMRNGSLDRKTAKQYIKDFCAVLHEHYVMKSSDFMGDTGQIILLGGSDADGNYRYNDLTMLFIEAIEELRLPDPKIMLKVNAHTPKQVLSQAIDCIATGIGSPLLANDDVIIPQMVAFGYKKEDALRYGVAACWEPLVPGASYDQNNMGYINFTIPLTQLLEQEDLSRITTFDSLLQKYKQYLVPYVEGIIHTMDHFELNEDIVMSTFTHDCREKHQDIAHGGARYNGLGFLSIGIGSTVNSLLNIERLVFQEGKYDLNTCKAAIENDFAGFDALQQDLKAAPYKYGMDNTSVLNLVHDISKTTNQCFKDKKTPLGGKFKFGLSSPYYLNGGQLTGATLDGRNAGQTFTPHISCEDGIPYTELIQFAGKLDYSDHRCNGNVVDFIVSPTLLRNNKEKFLIFLQQSIKAGFFEMQMNVVDSATLIDAKEDPDKFPNLIVRVWGFSAYFNDLPEVYKDMLIERARKAEKAA